ncbi:MAG TPA: LysM domain-containing protein [Acidimicrobiales bacterium]|nr:LysM domain-containing protein [Acidimicrobiales bacterium]
MTAVAHPLPVRPTGARATPGAGRRRGRPARTPPSSRGLGAAPSRRRRIVVALVALLALVVLGGGAVLPGRTPLTSPGPSPAAGVVPVAPVAETSYVVRPGDTLWGIARAAQPSGDVRPLVQWLARQRGGAPLRVGERLVLPPG